MESQIRKLRLSLETWREVILRINEIMLWKKQWYSTAIMGGCTVMFMLIWLFEPNLLTIISLLGLVITVGDYVLPALIATLFKAEMWTSEKQTQYEEICTNIVLYKTKFELLLSSYYRMKVTNSKLYFTITIFGLAFLAWIGGTISNLFLTYVLFLFILLLPGMSHNGMLNKGSETLSKIFSDLVENAKSRVGQKKIQ
ncbi:ADP-ribosylation factor-like protein 6-interacting protein 1 isoform X2 [Anoplophora glabripennis]|uniref:ADP-ribosylation factor-like protein 6-interacting protein 1 isoform X2 n=1 Tax=Anoplophora glabripennis TaxID=217634 RepID=UPI0008758CFF|nr:ADP-ribosylation factor-like protein 6-interacting protein 1 isoform X2 [Anoplophora glabripennis]